MVSAAAMSSRRAKAHALSFVLKQSIASPNRATKMSKIIKFDKSIKPMTPREGLATMVSADLSKKSYQIIRNTGVHHRADIYPTYDEVRAAKYECYPQNITITETVAEVKLSSLLNHTVSRLLEVPCVKEKISLLMPSVRKLGVFTCKWGFDGATGQSEYKQKRASGEDAHDANLFSTTMVPLDLSFGGKSVWTNPHASSTRFCRPKRLRYAKETTKLLVEEKNSVEDEIKELQPCLLSIIDDEGHPLDLEVEFALSLTMIDGKAANAVTGTASAQKCSICGATPKQMNTISCGKGTPISNQAALQFGVSPLHAWIRTFECVLHIGYRIHLQKWQVRGEEDKAKLAERKKAIQIDFIQKLGLRVDFPAQNSSGSGTSNDGNTARRSFQNPSLFSSITGVNEELITRLANILSLVNSFQKINLEKYKGYCQQTFTLYCHLYKWFYMPASLHKLLIHSSEVMTKFMLPIGMYSEEAQESRNKDNKNFRLHHARKDSRIHTFEDQFHYLLITSDPLISTMIIEKEYCKSKNKNKELSAEAKALLEDEEISNSSEIENETNPEEENSNASQENSEINDNLIENDIMNEINSERNRNTELPDYYFS